MNREKKRQSLLASLVGAAVIALALFLLYQFKDILIAWAADRTGLRTGVGETFVNVSLAALWLALAFVVVRAANELIFVVAFRKRKGYEAPDLIRNIFSLVTYTLVVALLLKNFFEVSLGPLFTTSAVFGVIIGLALQSTLGNLFAGISLQADKPFQVGDCIVVDHWVGIVESITWRGVKLRTLLNHVVLISNTTISTSAIEVCPRGNLNARTVAFNALYTDSPVKVIQAVREAVRETDNVSAQMTPIVRIKSLGESGVDYEVKYWLDNYALHNDTDALIRQRIWYAFRRAKLNFAYPTRTLYVEPRGGGGGRAARSSATARGSDAWQQRRVERLAAVDIFTPLSEAEMLTLAGASASHVFAPGEIIIRSGDEGTSMFVVHRGRVTVQRVGAGNQAAETIATLGDGDFFGEMGLFTGQPRTAHVVADEETEVLEINHDVMRELFETNPDLVEAVSRIIAERRLDLDSRPEKEAEVGADTAGVLSSIKRFFRLG